MTETVNVIYLDANRNIEKKKMDKKDNLLIDRKKGAFYTGKTSSFDDFFIHCITLDKTNMVTIEELYKEYKRFCDKYERQTCSYNQFCALVEQKLGKELDGSEIEGWAVNDLDSGQNGHITVNESKLHFLKKNRRLLGPKREPTYLVVEGMCTTVSFDELQSYLLTADNKPIVLTEDMLLAMQGGAVHWGSMQGKDYASEKMRKLVTIAAIAGVLAAGVVIILLVINLLGGGGGGVPRII